MKPDITSNDQLGRIVNQKQELAEHILGLAELFLWHNTYRASLSHIIADRNKNFLKQIFTAWVKHLFLLSKYRVTFQSQKGRSRSEL
jgi:hypothetical protein